MASSASTTATAGGDTRFLDLGATLLRLTLALIFLIIGAYKFTAYEAEGIQLFVANSPLTSWWNELLGVRGTANMLGIVEISIGLLLLYGFIRKGSLLALAGAIGSIVAYLITLSFLLTTPGTFAAEAGGFPVLSAEVGQFLAKDMVLLAASLFLAGESFAARTRQPLS